MQKLLRNLFKSEKDFKHILKIKYVFQKFC